MKNFYSRRGEMEYGKVFFFGRRELFKIVGMIYYWEWVIGVHISVYGNFQLEFKYVVIAEFVKTRWIIERVAVMRYLRFSLQVFRFKPLWRLDFHPSLFLCSRSRCVSSVFGNLVMLILNIWTLHYKDLRQKSLSTSISIDLAMSC